ncbi:Acyl carrier protein 1, mitochondrial [Vitis vinifera]|uniref:Acyl carrier protein 1, mitochondrial n=1 Tax=Vitis vinifera TaxID=29760 RepID=A0A438BX42_VITVI|nr:Acyl carrier protein 1, mitochondrial [Vitis vinifera]
MALRAAILRHIRVPVLQTLAPASTASNWQRWIRPMSSHGDDHLQKEEVIERVLSVVKSFPKVDPSQVNLVRSKDVGCLVRQGKGMGLGYGKKLGSDGSCFKLELVLKSVMVGE